MDEKKDRKIIVKLICVLLSFSLWLYITNVENPTRSITIKDVPVQLNNEEILDNLGLALSSNQDLKIDLKIEGPANKVYSVSRGDFSLAIDLGEYALKNGENIIPVKVLEFPDGINIKGKDVLSIKINIEGLVEKKFKVENQVNISYKEGYSASSFNINPSEVTVYGAESLVNKVSKVVLVGKASEVDTNYSNKYEIWPIDNLGNKIEGLELSHNKGDLKINVNKGKEVSVKVNYIGNLEQNLTLTNESLSKKTIYVWGSSEVIDKLNFIETEAINLSNIKANSNLTCNLILPEGVKSEDSTVTLSLTIEENNENIDTRKTLEVPIQYIYENSQFNYEGPDTVSITLLGKEEDLKNVTVNNIKVEVSLKDIVEVSNEKSVQWNATLLNLSNVTIEKASGTITIKVTEKI